MSIDRNRAIELAYGILWHCPTDRTTDIGEAAHAARAALYLQLDREARQRGVFAAQKVLDMIRPVRLSQ